MPAAIRFSERNYLAADEFVFMPAEVVVFATLGGRTLHFTKT